MNSNTNITHDKNKQHNKKLAIAILIILLINIIAFIFYFQVDLTQDKRYTLTPSTEQMLTQLNQQVNVTVLLENEQLPAGYKNLRNATEEMLRKFKDINKNAIHFKFKDPLDADSSLMQKMQEYKINGFPTTVSDGKKGMTQKLIFPWAIINVNGKEQAVLLQESSSPMINRKSLGQSALLLEYNLANGIHQLVKSAPDTIAYLTGNGQPDHYEVYSAVNLLASIYAFEAITLQDMDIIPRKYKSIIINRPMIEFSEVDKFKVDQYIMNGGNVLWAVDAVYGSIDSFNEQGQFTSVGIPLGLNDLLFNYGLRINYNLIGDIDQSILLPLEAKDGSKTDYPFVYMPIMNSASDHPVVKNLNEVLGQFVSTIDLVNENEHITKTPLLQTGKYSRVQGVPLQLNLMDIMYDEDRNKFNSGPQLTAVLMEGTFSSLFKSRIPPAVSQMAEEKGIEVLQQSKQNGKQIFISDGSVFMNEVHPSKGPFELGMFRYSQYRFNNRAFLLNCVDYLTDDNNLLLARGKTFHTSLLDTQRVQEETSKWQWINIAFPIGLVIIGASAYLFIRKRKFEQ